MSPLLAVVLAAASIAGTGVVALLLARLPRAATAIAVAGSWVGGALGLWASVAVLRDGLAMEASSAWAIPGGVLAVGIDPLSAFFLAPLFVLGGMCAVYGRSYLGPLTMQAGALNLLLAAMTIVVVARHALLFLVAWETMTLLAYLLVASDHGEAEVRRAGWIFLVASHIGVAALLALFLVLSSRTGGALDFASFSAAWQSSASGSAAILILSLVGFGIKAGVVPLHVWLPEAHAAAPSHVSALMSAVLIELGLYGLVRTTLFVPTGACAWFGEALMVLGIVGALLGVVFALAQRDLKRILAYSSIENVGIVLVGLGLGFWARAHGDARLSAIAFGGGLLHVWNHAAMKGLMFLGAGSVLHGTGTKDIERLGGLMTRMRFTASAMILGSVAIAGLPPLCGTTGEWLLYRGLTELGTSGEAPASLAAMGGAAALALAGGLAALCFVRLVGIVLLGTPRAHATANAHESPVAMIVPIWILAATCVAGSVGAPALVTALGPVLTEIHAAGPLDAARAAGVLHPLVVANLVLLAAIGVAVTWVIRRVARTRHGETWGCGYAAPTARMQYSGRGFSELFTTRALPRWLRPKVRARPPEGTFPTGATLATEMADPLTRGIYEPLLVRTGDAFSRLRFLQQGNLHVYLLYVLAAVLGGLTWVAVRDWPA